MATMKIDGKEVGEVIIDDWTPYLPEYSTIFKVAQRYGDPNISNIVGKKGELRGTWRIGGLGMGESIMGRVSWENWLDVRARHQTDEFLKLWEKSHLATYFKTPAETEAAQKWVADNFNKVTWGRAGGSEDEWLYYERSHDLRPLTVMKIENDIEKLDPQLRDHVVDFVAEQLYEALYSDTVIAMMTGKAPVRSEGEQKNMLTLFRVYIIDTTDPKEIYEDVIAAKSLDSAKMLVLGEGVESGSLSLESVDDYEFFVEEIGKFRKQEK